MRFSITKFFRNLGLLGRVDLGQMVDFERQMLERHNDLVDDVKSLNNAVRIDVGIRSGSYVLFQPTHARDSVGSLCSVPLDIAAEVEDTLSKADARTQMKVAQALAREAQAKKLTTRRKRAKR
jgi:hypothetical protein